MWGKKSYQVYAFAFVRSSVKIFYARNNFDLKIVKSKADIMFIIEKQIPSQPFCIMKRFMFQEQENEYL